MMAQGKVEICGVNTSKLPLLTEEEKEELLARIKEGDEEAKDRYIKGNLRLVLSVIKRFSASSENPDDLFQIGCLGLCKAAKTDKPGHTVAFSTYAYRLIRNEIYSELERATRRGREVATDPAELPCTVLDDDTPEQREACSALLARLERAEAGAAGVTAKGFQAIRMLMDGYTNREIGEMFGVPANHVTAWVSRARKALGASE